VGFTIRSRVAERCRNRGVDAGLHADNFVPIQLCPQRGSAFRRKPTRLDDSPGCFLRGDGSAIFFTLSFQVLGAVLTVDILDNRPRAGALLPKFSQAKLSNGGAMNKRNKKPEKASKTPIAGSSVGIQTNGIPVGGNGVSISINRVPVDDDDRGSVRILVNGVPIPKVQEEETVSQARKDES
jgi:hypothetical protein